MNRLTLLTLLALFALVASCTTLTGCGAGGPEVVVVVDADASLEVSGVESLRVVVRQPGQQPVSFMLERDRRRTRWWPCRPT